MYRALIAFETDHDRKFQMYRRSAQLLEPIFQDLNPQAYLLLCRQLVYIMALHPANNFGKPSKIRLFCESSRLETIANVKSDFLSVSLLRFEMYKNSQKQDNQ